MKAIINTLSQVLKLQRLQIRLDESEEGRRLYNYFTKKHPRLILIGNKTTGIALINANDFDNYQQFLDSVSGKNSAAYFSRKSMRSGFEFQSINPTEFENDIMQIHISAGSRQGRSMDESYKKKIIYPLNSNNMYYGLFKDGRLVAYVWLVFTGELVLFNRIMGHTDFLASGIMYQLVLDAVKEVMMHRPQSRYLMYDTWFGGSDGLRLFKKRCGFKPYKVKWLPC